MGKNWGSKGVNIDEDGADTPSLGWRLRENHKGLVTVLPPTLIDSGMPKLSCNSAPLLPLGNSTIKNLGSACQHRT